MELERSQALLSISSPRAQLTEQQQRGNSDHLSVVFKILFVVCRRSCCLYLFLRRSVLKPRCRSRTDGRESSSVRNFPMRYLRWRYPRSAAGGVCAHCRPTKLHCTVTTTAATATATATTAATCTYGQSARRISECACVVAAAAAASAHCRRCDCTLCFCGYHCYCCCCCSECESWERVRPRVRVHCVRVHRVTVRSCVTSTASTAATDNAHTHTQTIHRRYLMLPLSLLLSRMTDRATTQYIRTLQTVPVNRGSNSW